MRKSNFVTLVLSLGSLFGFSQPIVWNDAMEGLLIGEHISLLEDSARFFTIEQVSDEAFDGLFKASQRKILKFPNSVSPFWLKFQIHNTHKTPLVLVLEQGIMPFADLYYKTDSSRVWQVMKAGSSVNLYEKLVKHHHQVFRLPAGSVSCFLRMNGTIISAPIRIWKQATFELGSMKHMLGIGLYIGLMLFVILYNLFWFLSMWRFSYLHYAAFAFFMLAFVAVNHGFVLYALPDLDIIKSFIRLSILLPIVGLSYAVLFLNMRRYAPRFMTFGGAIGLVLLALLVTWPRIPQPTLQTYIQLTLLVLYAYIVTSAIVVGRRGNRVGYYFAMTYFIFFAFFFAHAFNERTGRLPLIFHFTYLSVGILVEVLLQSFLLTKRFEWEKAEIEAAKGRTKAELLEKTLEHEQTLREQIIEREQHAFEQRETERVKVLEQMKTNFFSNVTHEFRTPLTLIIEPLRRILQKNKDAETLENARLAEKNSQQLLSLVNQLLDMAKLESGQMSLDLRRADLAETVRGVFERFLPLAEKRGVKLVFRQDIQDLKDFEFDKGKVELILNNLISNALKFTLEGGRVEVNVGENVGGKNVGRVLNPADVKIQIRDTGIGIAPENLDRVFDRFYQVDGSNTRAGEGTGIGLALSKELAELMGGGISVESALGKGSTFTFWIPMDAGASVGVTQSHPDTMAYSAQSQDKEAMMPPVPRRPPSSEAPIVLVIEDNPDLRHFTKTALSGAGWQVVEASDGEEGAKKAFDLVPDLVVSDLMMPRKDGLAVVDELKNAELTAHIPIILLTAKSGIESKLAGLRRGADDYLTKPFNTDELLARMENLLENRRRLRQLFGAKTAPGTPSTAEGEAFLEAPDREFLQRFMLVLETNLADEVLGVEDFAKKMFISRVQLHRKLKAITDKNATDFIREFRLDRAYSMLKNREGMVSEIALRVGFGNEKYFSTVFKEKFGFPPSQIK